jgi:hypothetical protein
MGPYTINDCNNVLLAVKGCDLWGTILTYIGCETSYSDDYQHQRTHCIQYQNQRPQGKTIWNLAQGLARNKYICVY